MLTNRLKRERLTLPTMPADDAATATRAEMTTRRFDIDETISNRLRHRRDKRFSGSIPDPWGVIYLSFGLRAAMMTFPWRDAMTSRVSSAGCKTGKTADGSKDRSGVRC